MQDVEISFSAPEKGLEEKIEKELVEAPPEPELPPLNDFDIEVLSYVEQMYWTKGEVLTQQGVCEKLNLDLNQVQRTFEKERFRNALKARGILTESKLPGVLSPIQVLLVNMLLNTHDKKSLREKLQAANVTTQQYNAWLRDPTFQEYLRIRTEELFKGADTGAYQALIQATHEGDIQAIKFFFEMRGIYNPKLQVEFSVETVLARVVEVITKHVSDPVVLTRIADDLELVMATHKPGAAQVAAAIPRAIEVSSG